MVRTGIGYDSHRIDAGRRLVLGGRVLSQTGGLAGHSDADVLTHAVIDSLLGAIGWGDIGSHFPDTDPRWKDADSTAMLETIAARLQEQGASILHVDSTVICETIRLAPHIVSIRTRLAEAMGVAMERVSVKAKTNEGMGLVGKGEGMVAMAVATIDTGE